MNLLKRTIYALFFIFIGLPVLYFIVAVVLSYITVNTAQPKQQTETIYLSTNGVHLDIIIHTSDISPNLKTGLVGSSNYYAFGWGDENFYLNTPTWADLTFKNGFSALFLNSSSLMHVTRFDTAQPDWIEVKLTTVQLRRLNQQLIASFKTDTNGNKIPLPNAGYTPMDEFYKAHGSYTLFYTCNTWANNIFKKSGLTASYWTPFDKGLLSKWQNQ